MGNLEATDSEVERNKRVPNKEIRLAPMFSNNAMNLRSLSSFPKSRAGLENGSESVLVGARSFRIRQLAVEETQSAAPVVVLSEGFEDGVEGEDVGAVEEVGEDPRAVAHVSVGGADADELEGDEVGVEGGNGVGGELGLDLVEVAHGKAGGAL